MTTVDLGGMKRSVSKKETITNSVKEKNAAILSSNASKGKTSWAGPSSTPIKPEYDGYRQKDGAVRLMNNYTAEGRFILEPSSSLVVRT